MLTHNSCGRIYKTCTNLRVTTFQHGDCGWSQNLTLSNGAVGGSYLLGVRKIIFS